MYKRLKPKGISAPPPPMLSILNEGMSKGYTKGSLLKPTVYTITKRELLPPYAFSFKQSYNKGQLPKALLISKRYTTTKRALLLPFPQF
jgi:hypothetical protein